MLSFFGALGMTHSSSARPVRRRLTPGQLYRTLSSEFRLHRSPRCSCRMPMVFACERTTPDDANWNVEASPRHCPACRALTARIVAHFREVYDINDPGWPTAAPAPEAAPAEPETFGSRRVFG